VIALILKPAPGNLQKHYTDNYIDNSFYFFISSIFGQAEKAKLTISHLTGDFYIYTTFNKYKQDQVPANGMYLVTDNGVVMFDTPWDTTQHL
jgi:metallo-beta-lactamase class B